MSYSFDLMFKTVNSKLEAYELACQFAKRCYENAEEYLKDSKFYIPSERLRCDESANRYWLFQTFNFNFIYWDKYNLVAVLEQRYPEDAKKLFDVEFYFQNSTDQDYEYSEWGTGIPLFNEVIEKTKEMSAKELFNFFNKNRDWYNIEEIEANLDYFRRTAVYERIYDLLNLNSWLWDNEDFEFFRFSINSLDSTEKHTKTFNILQKVLYDLRKEEEEWKEKHTRKSND